MSSANYFNSFNPSPQFMDSKFGYFKGSEEIKVEDDTGKVLLSEQPFYQSSQPWNSVTPVCSDVSPGNFTNGGYHSFEDIVSKILDEEPPEIKVERADKFEKPTLDKISNENENHGAFSPHYNSLFNSNTCLSDNDLSQNVMSPNIMNQANNDYNNLFNFPKLNFSNQVELNGLLNLQQTFSNFNYSNPNVNYLNNYFLALQNSFIINPELFKSAMNPSFQNFQNLSQLHILENLLNNSCLKQSINLNAPPQMNRQAPMNFQSNKNVFVPSNSPFRVNVPIYKQPFSFSQSPQYIMDSMSSNYKFNQQNQQLFNTNSMPYKNQMDFKVTTNSPNMSVVIYIDLCAEQLNLLSSEEHKLSYFLRASTENKVVSGSVGDSVGGSVGGPMGGSAGGAVSVHVKLNNLITESFRLHYKVNVLLKEVLKCEEGFLLKAVQATMDGWLRALTRLQSKYKEELSRVATLNEGLATMSACVEEMHEHLRRVRTALWCAQEAACNDACAAGKTSHF